LCCTNGWRTSVTISVVEEYEELAVSI
jgi:hypothetical protein